jgi:chloramphenicol-sensitive protein RarD
MTDTNQADTNRGGNNSGFTAAITAFAIWGVFPLYFHPLHQVSSFQVIAHRVVWSCLLVLIVLVMRGQLSSLKVALADRGVVIRLALSATLITGNWTLFVWGVANGHVIEGSLGYFIGPLVNVLLGVVLLSEKLTRIQWTAVGFAAAGVAYLTFKTGGPPWIAVGLAFSFACYGLIRKVVKVESLPGLAAETLLLMPFAAGYLLWCESAGSGTFGHAGLTIDTLLVGSGPLTAITLFLFAYGTRLLPYSTIGVLQYLTPTLQFACGVFLLHEPFDSTRAIGFAFIWAAIAIYTGEGLRLSRKQPRAFA